MAPSKEKIANILKEYENVKQEDLRKVRSLAGRECSKLKKKYDACFIDWYKTEFLEGKNMPDMIPCEDLFKEYQKCVKLAFKRMDLQTDPTCSD